MGQSGSCIDEDIEMWLDRQLRSACLLTLPLNNGTTEKPEFRQKQNFGPLRRKLTRQFGLEKNGALYDCLRKIAKRLDHTPSRYHVTPSAQSEGTPFYEAVSHEDHKSDGLLRSFDKARGSLHKSINYAAVNVSPCGLKKCSDMFVKTPVRSDIPLRQMPSKKYYDTMKIHASPSKHEQITRQYETHAFTKYATMNSQQSKIPSPNLIQQQNLCSKANTKENSRIIDEQPNRSSTNTVDSRHGNVKLPKRRTIICTDCGECLPESVLSKYIIPHRSTLPQKQSHQGTIVLKDNDNLHRVEKHSIQSRNALPNRTTVAPPDGRVYNHSTPGSYVSTSGSLINLEMSVGSEESSHITENNDITELQLKNNRIIPSSNNIQNDLSNDSLNDSIVIQQWLQDVQTQAKDGCQNTQFLDPGLVETLVVCKSLDTIVTLQDQIDIIMSDFTYVLKTVENNQWEKFRFSVVQLCTDIREFCQTDETSILNKEPEIIKVHHQLLEACSQVEACSKIDFEREREQTIRSLKKTIELIQRLTENIFLQEIKVLVDDIEKIKTSICLKRSIAALTSLGLFGERMCEVIVKAGGVKALIAICMERKWRHLHSAVFRSLTVICSVPSAVREIEEAKVIEFIINTLCNDTSSNHLRSEAAGLIAQITAPWMDSSVSNLPSITENMKELVKYLTDLASTASTQEVFLLATAALAHLSSYNTSACDWLRKFQTLRVLVSACYHGDICDLVFIREQVMTVISNMAASQDCGKEVIDSGAVELLIHFLQAQPPKSQSQAELAACERMQEKSAIVLAHLYTNKDTTAKIVQIKGVQQLLCLCKDEEKNYCNSLLVTCEETARKYGTACDTQDSDKLETTELLKDGHCNSYQQFSSEQMFFI
ncbi:uncharacterized protein LOC143246267 [Tachypleus tridentatus]|uniref:uncharacterized protein LOC143246267 n=1 Tax=Tachypleus tridentatus TaxID=6853 RepID=UPI003FD67BBF